MLERDLYSIDEARERLGGISRNLIYEILRNGRLSSVVIGSRRFIPAAASRVPSITARPTPAEKERFATLAASRGMSESTLALIAIRSLLDCNDVTEPNAAPARRERSIDRITIRLRPGDRRVINERANRRGMKASTYLAALVRAHIATNPPLTDDELGAYKQGVIVLAGLGRLLTRFSRDAVKAASDLGGRQRHGL